MASRSDSGNETRGSSESDNSPTPTKELQSRTRFTPTKQISTPIVTPTPRGQINTRTTPVSRTTPTTRPYPQNNYKPTPHRLTPTAQRGPVRPLQRRPPSSGMGSAGSVHAVTPLGSLGPLGPLTSTRGRQRNSVAIVDSRDHIYEELEMCRGGPPKIAPVSGVLQQGKVVIRPIAFKPVLTQGAQFGSQVERSPSGSSTGIGNSPSCQNGNTYPTVPGRPDPRYTSTPTLIRGPIQHYGSMGDLKSLGHSSSYSLDRRGIGVPVNSRAYYDPYLENNNNNNSNDPNNKVSNYTKLYNSKNNQLNKSNTHIINISSPQHSNSSNVTSPASSKGSPNSNLSSAGSNSTNRTGNNSSASNSPPSYPLPPPRPPSHQSICSNIEDGQTHHHHSRFPSFDNRLSNTYDPMPSYDHAVSTTTTTTSNSYPRTTTMYESSSLKYPTGPSPATELPRFESLRNLSSGEPHGSYSSASLVSHNNHTRHHHQRMGGSVSNLTRLHHNGSISGSNLGLDRSFSVTGSNLGLDRSVSGSNLGLERTGSISGSLSELHLNDHHQTPSPSDSGVAELEQMLKEKDSEINNLKETMEQNEQVIFKVYEEKEKTWERELKKIRDMYDSRLKAAQQKALKVEQSLTTQTYQLQQERRKLSAELEEVKRERESSGKQVEQLRKEITSLRSQLEETEWGLCQKSGEISLLKTQLKDSQGDQTTRGHELLHLRAQVRQYQQEIERRRAEITSLHDLTGQLRRETTELRSQVDQSHQSHSQHDHGKAHQQAEKSLLEVDTLKRERESQRKVFEEERAQWVEEKNRVIRYQKQLHHNYVAMLTRNRQLEEEVARLAGVPLPPLPSQGGNSAPSSLPSLTANCHGQNGLPPFSSSNGSNPSVYSDVREAGTISISSESRC